MPRSKPSDKVAYLVIVAATLLAACMSCALAAGLLQVWPPPGLAEKGFLTRLCITVSVGGYNRVASWVSPAISARTGHIRLPSIEGRIVCGFVPWSPSLPANSTWEIER